MFENWLDCFCSNHHVFMIIKPTWLVLGVEVNLVQCKCIEFILCFRSILCRKMVWMMRACFRYSSFRVHFVKLLHVLYSGNKFYVLFFYKWQNHWTYAIILRFILHICCICRSERSRAFCYAFMLMYCALLTMHNLNLLPATN